MAVRTAGNPEQIIARVEAGSRKFSFKKIICEARVPSICIYLYNLFIRASSSAG